MNSGQLRSWSLALMVTVVAGVAGCSFIKGEVPSPRLVGEGFRSERPEGPGELRVMSLNVAHGGGLAIHPIFVHQDDFDENLDVTVELLRREKPHVIALQEADASAPWTGGFDHVAYIAEQSGYAEAFLGIHVVLSFFGPKLQAGTGLLSSLPLHDPVNIRFATKGGELQGYVRGRVPMPGVPDMEVDVVSLHLMPGSEEVRAGQIAELLDAIGKPTRPLIVMGDFNCEWEGTETCVGVLVDRLGMKVYEPEAKDFLTFSSRSPKRRLDWIVISEELEFGSYRHLQDQVSDHLPVMATVRLRPDILAKYVAPEESPPPPAP